MFSSSTFVLILAAAARLASATDQYANAMPTAAPTEALYTSTMPYSWMQTAGYNSADCGYGYSRDSSNHCTQASWYSLSGCYQTSTIVNQVCGPPATVTKTMTRTRTMTETPPPTTVTCTVTETSTMTDVVDHTQFITTTEEVLTTRIWMSTVVEDRTNTVERTFTATETMTNVVTRTVLSVVGETETATFTQQEHETVTVTQVSEVDNTQLSDCLNSCKNTWWSSWTPSQQEQGAQYAPAPSPSYSSYSSGSY